MHCAYLQEQSEYILNDVTRIGLIRAIRIAGYIDGTVNEKLAQRIVNKCLDYGVLVRQCDECILFKVSLNISKANLSKGFERVLDAVNTIRLNYHSR